jgi:hypothetical protein
MSDPTVEDVICRGCGTPAGRGVPTPDHCSDCPPWTCDGCGQPDSFAAPCSCWVDLTGMARADIKALFAATDDALSVDIGRR